MLSRTYVQKATLRRSTDAGDHWSFAMAKSELAPCKWCKPSSESSENCSDMRRTTAVVRSTSSARGSLFGERSGIRVAMAWSWSRS